MSFLRKDVGTYSFRSFFQRLPSFKSSSLYINILFDVLIYYMLVDIFYVVVVNTLSSSTKPF